MAVYTDITEGELGAFLQEYALGELLSYKGIAEGAENSNFLLHTSSGAYILTLYEKRVEQADLPFFLGLMEHLAKKGISCPLPVHRRDGAGDRRARRPPGRADHLPRRHVAAPADGRALPRGRQGAGRHASGRRRFSAVARRTRWRSTAGASCGTARGPRRRGRAGACRRSRRAISTISSATGRRTCRPASSMPTSSPTTFLPRRPAVRADRLLFRLQRSLRLRRRRSASTPGASRRTMPST